MRSRERWDPDVRLWLRGPLPAPVDIRRRPWEANFTGGHLLHLAAAGCILNDLYVEATALGITLNGVCVSAGGRFDTATSQSTGIWRPPASCLSHLNG